MTGYMVFGALRARRLRRRLQAFGRQSSGEKGLLLIGYLLA